MSTKTPPIRQVLYFPHSERALLSAGLGHLYELSKVFNVTLITESISPLTRKIIRNLSLRNVSHIEVDPLLTYRPIELITNIRKHRRFVEQLLESTHFDLIVTENDCSSLFEMLLLRSGRDRGIRTMSLAAMSQAVADDNRLLIENWFLARRGYPRGARRKVLSALFRARKTLAKIFVLKVIPAIGGVRGFALRGGCYIDMSGAPGMRDSLLHIVQTESQADCCQKSGVSASRLAVLSHPGYRIPRNSCFVQPEVSAIPEKILLVLCAQDLPGIFESNRMSMDITDRADHRRAIISFVSTIFKNWIIIVKPHPYWNSTTEVRKHLGIENDEVGKIRFIHPSEPVEKFLQTASLVIDLPPGWSSALGTAAAVNRDVPVVALNTQNELMGDMFKNWPGVIYFDDIARFKAFCTEFVKTMSYSDYCDTNESESNSKFRRFSSVPEACQYILQTPDIQ